MKKLRSAREVTFFYFAVVAIAMITIHFALVESTVDELELLNAQNALEHKTEDIINKLQNSPSELQYITRTSQSYVGLANVPKHFDIDKDLPYNQAIEVYQPNGYATDYFVMKRLMTNSNGHHTDLYTFYFDEIYELSEDQIFKENIEQAVISVILLIITLTIMLLISRRLNHPLSVLTHQLRHRSANDLSPIVIPQGVKTQELTMLVDSLNQYQDRIKQSIERERAFNRYASHELRTPLMVIKGSTSLLAHSLAPEFIEKQRDRLSRACDEMNDFVTTLLSLTREENLDELQSRELTKDELEEIVQSHLHLLKNKPVEYRIELSHSIDIKIPKTSLKILVGNLLKNAFSCTEKGSVVISVTPLRISIIDTGIGLEKKPRGVEGYGLGLLISRDICHKYGYEFELLNNPYGGCTAQISIQPTQ
ncbi:two-component sensor histidine kinase [Photobacterium sp. GB-50]|uniref:sensor histidine kinase n=1 Tax=Photobacterium sp. GB-50 TaxID=2022107 RepID=UPI000D153B46|nr:histidine kinase dimerization/phospho-acceptor domain-containing protein [Photobacterium sp. GB-50]PSW72305.1 two-component sensor histidine kinase [Photobacterium sp. GB-50]